MSNENDKREQLLYWLSHAPSDDIVNGWLRTLYNDNILAVSRGGENIAAAFSEYGKKLLADRIRVEILSAKGVVRNDPAVRSGVELLNPLKPANYDKKEK